jgi:hypothetical protein
MTVGASTDDGVTALVAQLIREGAEPQQIEMRLMEGSVTLPSPAIDLPYVVCGQGLSAQDFPAEVDKKIALVQRGEISFYEKATNAANAGAAAVVIYNNRDGNFFGSLGDQDPMPAIPVVSISKLDGETMVAAIGGTGRVSSARLQLTPEEVAQPDRLAEFSSRGPNNDGWIKPEITAPGVNINSATIVKAAMPGGGMPDPTGYTSASGTSMATPHVTGVVALIRQAHPEWSPLQIKAALVNTARLMPNQGTVIDQGNGAVDLARAIDCRAVLVTATDAIGPTHSFGQVVNEGKAMVVKQSLTIHPLDLDSAGSSYKLAVELTGQPQGLTAELSAGSINCSGDECVASFDLILTADGATLADGAYYGWVVAEADWGKLRLPFYYEAAQKASSLPPKAEHGTPATDPHRRVGAMPCC